MAKVTYSSEVQYKDHFDGRGAGLSIVSAMVETSDATATVIKSIPVAELSACQVMVRTIGLKADASEAIRSVVSSGFRRAAAGNVTEIGSDSAIGSAEDSSGTPTVTLIANTSDQTIDIKVTGEASKDFVWESIIEVQKVSL